MCGHHFPSNRKTNYLFSPSFKVMFISVSTYSWTYVFIHSDLHYFKQLGFMSLFSGAQCGNLAGVELEWATFCLLVQYHSYYVLVTGCSAESFFFLAFQQLNTTAAVGLNPVYFGILGKCPNQ